MMDLSKAPPAFVGPYEQSRALEDIPAIKHALSMFLSSQMVASEEYCNESDPKREHLYITSGYSLIQCLKALMSYEDKDLQAALVDINRGNALAAKHRAPPVSVASRISGLVWGSQSVDAIRAMTAVQRHAELLYAETTFAKALVGTVCSGSWLGFVKEALSFRTMINVYMSLGKYLKTADAEAGGKDVTIDDDFRSGVNLGVGASNLILSLMPRTLLSVAELFGYQGDRRTGLAMLYEVGGWSKDRPEPQVSAVQEGVRRPLADMCLLCFHLVLSSFVHDGVDIPLAQQILEWNLQRYPDGVFFLFGAGRLRLLRSQPHQAKEFYERAMIVQNQYPNLHYISHWELAVCTFALWDVPASLRHWRALYKDATWSRACYAYGMAVCLLQIGGMGEKADAADALKRIPGLLNKIAGKSIPIEKFVARKARKFDAQGGRLALPALEFAYFFLAIAHAPREIIVHRMMPEVDRLLARLHEAEAEPATYEGGRGYWDDLCLARFLEGICMRYVAYPDKDAVVSAEETTGAMRGPASMRALRAFKAVLEDAHKIELDHYIVYHTHYELGRLYACLGNTGKAREHLELVVTQKALEPAGRARKVRTPSRRGKYSMQSALVVRAGAALESIEDPAPKR